MKKYTLNIVCATIFCLVSSSLFSQSADEGEHEVSPFSVKPANYEEKMRKRSAEYKFEEENPMMVKKVKKDTTNNNKNNSGSKTEHRVLPSKSDKVVNSKSSSNSSPQ